MPEQSISKTCSIDGCCTKSRKRGWCEKHYSRWKNHGSPTKVKAISHRWMTLQERFNAQYEVVTESGCWIWMGSLTRHYGTIWVDGRAVSSHRISYIIHIGDIPDGLNVLHRCDVYSCVNPNHLFIGTQKDNMSDMTKKGRSLVGSMNSAAKLSESDVRNILHRKGERLAGIAKDYGVTLQSIWNIMNGKTWTHIKNNAEIFSKN